MNVLTLREAVSETLGGVGSFVTVEYRHVAHFLDLDIDGQPLRDRYIGAEDMVTFLNRDWLHALDGGIAELTGKQFEPYLLPGRIALLRCQVCGDIGCYALTALLEVTADTVTWSHFAWEADRDDSLHILEPGLRFTFDREAYVATIEGARSWVETLPYNPRPPDLPWFRQLWQWLRRSEG